MMSSLCGGLFPYLDGGSQDGELGRLSSGLVGLQDLPDELLDLPLRHAVAVARLPEDVDALGEFVINARLARGRPHGSSFSVAVLGLQLDHGEASPVETSRTLQPAVEV